MWATGIDMNGPIVDIDDTGHAGTRTIRQPAYVSETNTASVNPPTACSHFRIPSQAYSVGFAAFQRCHKLVARKSVPCPDSIPCPTTDILAAGTTANSDCPRSVGLVCWDVGWNA